MKRVLFSIVFFQFLLVPFTAAAQDKRPYAAYDEETKTLTFYYDDQKEAREGMYFEPAIDRPSPTSTPWKYSAGPIETVVFDPSMADCHSITSTAFWFHDIGSLTNIVGLENLNTENVTDMKSMFRGCGIYSIDLTMLDTRNVTDMTDMFYYCVKLSSVNMSGLDTRNVRKMSWMFSCCYTLSSIDLSNIDTSNVTSMIYMFNCCSSLTNLDVSNFNTQNVTTTEGMFAHCSSLTSLDVSNFNTQHMTTIAYMFASCTSLKTIDVSNFDTTNVTDMSAMFDNCTMLTTIYCNVNWDTGVTPSAFMFYHCISLKGAATYKEWSWDARWANPYTGYFTRTATGITKPEKAEGGKASIYDLQGRRLMQQPRKGVYILDGHKVVRYE